MTSNDDLDEVPRAGASMVAPAAIVAMLIGIAAGGAVGYAAHALLSEPEVVIPPVQVIKEEISDEDLMALCEELTDGEKVKVVAAQERVMDLQSRLDAKEAELDALQKQGEQDEARKKAAAKKWKEMEDEIASLRIQLAEAELERDELRVELKETLVKLDKQVEETRKYKAKAIHYKKESTANLWSAFGANAKVQICDRGTRKRHEKCHEAVESVFNVDMREKFTVCVDTFQAVPVLRKADDKDDVKLPTYATWLPDDNKFTRKGWYVIFCDPTLPEAQDADLERDTKFEDLGNPDFGELDQEGE